MVYVSYMVYIVAFDPIYYRISMKNSYINQKPDDCKSEELFTNAKFITIMFIVNKNRKLFSSTSKWHCKNYTHIRVNQFDKL